MVARDLKALSQFLTDSLMQIEGVANVRSMICLEEIKPPSPLPTDGLIVRPAVATAVLSPT